MPLEIERRFLVRSRLLPPLGSGRRLEQAYLSQSPEVRVRLITAAEGSPAAGSGVSPPSAGSGVSPASAGSGVSPASISAGFITVKTDGGITRAEYEYPVPPDHAREMLQLTPWSVIAKTRYKLPLDGLVWEIDAYEGDNAGLWSAEVELESEDTTVSLPRWLADEVTEERRFNNRNLAQEPLSTWPDRQRILSIVSS
jgi:adenylate cyclase